MARSYDDGRSLLAETVAMWRDAVRPLRPESPFPVLDLGAGTGRFSSHLVDWFDRDVVAVEPASAMREQGRRKAHDRVGFVGGAAEHLPLRDGTCSLAWLSNVVHHFRDMRLAAHELRRTLRLAGRVLVRGWFPDRSTDLPFWEFFPGARAIAQTFPTAAEIEGTFRHSGFAIETVITVDQVIAEHLRDLIARVRLRTDSTLAPLSDEEFAEGLARLEAEAAERPSKPVHAPLDLLVLR